jgi:hypothetical protein
MIPAFFVRLRAPRSIGVGLSFFRRIPQKARDSGAESRQRKKKLSTPGLYPKLFVHWQEQARQATCALAGTPAYKHSQRARYKVEALFAELK